MHEDFVIIGGGVAGLCAAIRLTELGIKPLVLEGGSYPCHKVCGEFISPECLPKLRQWGIETIPIYEMNWRSTNFAFNFNFPQPAGSLSHVKLDPILANQAQVQGAKILTNRSVKSFYPKSHANQTHVIELNDGEVIRANHAIIATGKIPGYLQKKPHFPYVGIKAHFHGLPIENRLEMISFRGGYIGLAPIENHAFNVACLVKQTVANRQGGAEKFIKKLIVEHPILKKYFIDSRPLFSWMTAPIPAFGIRDTPKWIDVYFIGDAAASISPACGNGLSMAISGGCLSAEYAVESRFQDFKTDWNQRCHSQIKWGNMLNQIMLNPFLSQIGIKVATIFPALAHQFFFNTRQ